MGKTFTTQFSLNLPLVLVFNIGCPSGEYVSPSNFTCFPCPSNTRDDVAGVAECECLIGFFRAHDENADFGCTRKFKV